MDDNVKGAIVGAIITSIVSIVIFIVGNFSTQATLEKHTVETLAGYFDSVDKDMSYKQALQIIYGISKQNNEDITKKESEILSLKNSSITLEQENTNIKNENIRLKQQIEIYQNKNNESSTEEINNTTFLGTLPVFNAQYFERGTWYSSELYTWDKRNDKAADGKTYEKAVLLSVQGNWYNYAQIVVIDYLLNKDYVFFNTKYMLTETSKSTATQFIISIYGDDKLIYASELLTGGFSPITIDNLDVSNVVKMRIEISSEVGQLGNVGILLVDPTLT